MKDAQQEVRNLTVMEMRPDLPPEKRDIIKQLERSARAEVQLRVKALNWQIEQDREKG
ncbi:hypothetical protein QCM77_19390 [Bradyrhizobium sp. SSUT18]|uniref:hypothetical protein n=1 Tax=Bradyrhizobium sp. SSUT18 TaxID=3040602 RepID=UPI00244C28EA|nr:hypothetical protein [Bradyrhizobium sp. SSUT18]MDH2402107.1 hypothetical protein [Bradyrhizobium sp. SSUT18]